MSEGEEESEPGAHDELFGFGRWERAERTENDEAFQALLHRLDVESALTDFDEPPGAYEIYNELTVVFKWSEIFRYADGVLEHMVSMDNDPIGYAIDAYLEPRYDHDESEVIKRSAVVEYAEDVDTVIFRRERERPVEMLSSGHLEDLPDDRRAGKAGLPADDRDVTNELVVMDPDPRWGGRPSCARHGAMNRVDPVERLYRCQMCGVGARWVPTFPEEK